MSNNRNINLLKWFSSGNICKSSRTLACASAGLEFKKVAHPKTPEDINRCLILLKTVPELRLPMQHKMPCLSESWAALTEQWDDIESIFLEEAGLGFIKSAYAPKTSALLREIHGRLQEGKMPKTNNVEYLLRGS
ncbi:hypothetical protein N9M08_07010 [Porticoccaceae bacterium]|nr:hypothetical protein [Porticoccaceae bacterium]MDA8682268.1 hypothetical protein [Porticoccaceae bacterium]MDA8788885.1 hypothetical protein [Porticoccaceae bacterium]MDB2343795.1 hypothetical protein [Porticoccaceae bacterium]